MGFFAQLKRSNTKTKLMNNLIKALDNPRDTQTIELTARAFYDFIAQDYLLGPILRKYNASYALVKQLILRLNEAVGGKYGGWMKGQYLPVSTFGFTQSLECVLKEYHAGSSIELMVFELQKLM